MEFYKGIYGGELTVQTYDEAPPNPDTDKMKGKVMHAALMGGDAELMASDSPFPDNLGGGKISISLSGYDEPKLRGFFEKLSDGAKINMPLKKEFWGDTFGALTDKFGVSWMVNISPKKDE